MSGRRLEQNITRFSHYHHSSWVNFWRKGGLFVKLFCVQVGCAVRGSVRVERHLHGQTKFQTICWSSEDIVIEGTAFAILAG